MSALRRRVDYCGACLLVALAQIALRTKTRQEMAETPVVAVVPAASPKKASPKKAAVKKVAAKKKAASKKAAKKAAPKKKAAQ